MSFGPDEVFEIEERHAAGRPKSGDAVRLARHVAARLKSKGDTIPGWVASVYRPLSESRPLPRTYNAEGERLLVGDLLDELEALDAECPF